MRDELLTYYERELSYLRQMGTEFAAKYPKVASRLALESDRCEDPHVERLIEAVAFLAARVRHKIDDDLPEITDSILGMLYPHYLAPVPSMTTVEFQLDAEHGKLTSAYDIPRHTVLTTKPVRGIRCRFRTCFPVQLWPIAVADATLETPPPVTPLGGPRGFTARALIRLRLRMLAGAKWADLRPPSLRFFLQGESALTAGLYEMLCGAPVQVEVHPGRRSATRTGVVLPAGSLAPVGFGRDEVAVPFPRHSFRGYALLEEYFAYPQKFLHVELKNLERGADVADGEELEVRIFTGRAPEFDQRVQAQTFRLGCTPIINLFERQAEPIWLDHTKAEYRIVPDVHGPWAHEVYSVDQVVSAGDDPGSVRTFQPFYAVRHGVDGDDGDAFWHATRRQSLDGATEVYLSLLDGRFSPTSPPVETVSVRVTATNRDLPAQIPFSGAPGADLDSEHLAPFVKILCLGKPTAPRRREPGRGAHWRLISHLTLNYLSLVADGKEALQGILELYDFGDSAVTRRQIAAITRIETERIVRLINGAFCRGLRVKMDLDREGFVGSGAYLFAAVIECFLGLYTSLNSFTQLVARVEQDEEPLRTWPPRAGEQILL